MKRWMLTEAAFLGGVLLAAGSRITENDLPVGPEMEPAKMKDGMLIPAQPKEGGKMIRSAPPPASIEIDASGQPVASLSPFEDSVFAAASTVTEVLPVAPHAPNPTMPQAIPPHAVGEVAPLGTFAPAEGAQGSTEGTAADLEAEMAAATGGAPAATVASPAPQRRGK